jgi:hypothetical protein
MAGRLKKDPKHIVKTVILYLEKTYTSVQKVEEFAAYAKMKAMRSIVKGIIYEPQQQHPSSPWRAC